jgi:DNA recombination protein RmuC
MSTLIVILAVAVAAVVVLALLAVKSMRKSHETALQNEERHHAQAVEELKASYETRQSEVKAAYEKQLADAKEANEKQLAEVKESYEKQQEKVNEANEKQLNEVKTAYEKQLNEVKEAYKKHLTQAQESSSLQLNAIREMNEKQLNDQINLIKEQMTATSESVLKARQEELAGHNAEQMNKIISPIEQGLRDMKDALNNSKQLQRDAMTRLDATIKQSMEQSHSLGQTADRLTRALTGEVKAQGNFGELKLKQWLEELGLNNGEQFDTQETLRDKYGKAIKSDEGKGLIPDFILHFPEHRHVVVDSKMSLTDYERYMSTPDSNTEEKSKYLHAHIASVRAQVKRLAGKDYSRYMPDGSSQLQFVMMYIPIEGAYNLALQNETSLWHEAYKQGVMILGPQNMYMSLRVLEVMWQQERQLKNQQEIMKAANTVVDRVQDFAKRFKEVDDAMQTTVTKINKLKITTANNGSSIVTAARNLLKAGARENKNKVSLSNVVEYLADESGDEPAALPDETAALPDETAAK